LPVDLGSHSAALLGLGFKLGLECREFGERGVRIWGFLALAAIESGRPRRPAVLLTRRTVGAMPTVLTVLAAPVTRWPLRLGGRGGTGRLCDRFSGLPLAAIGRRSRLLSYRRAGLAVVAAALARTSRAVGPARPPNLDHGRFFDRSYWLG
jgi:hypothetical protein